jgi:hypothetical protein
MDTSIKQNQAEQGFQNWLDKHGIAYWSIKQSINSFSPALKENFTKRPDFLILIPNIGLIIIEVKYKKQATKHNKFFLNAAETDKYVNLQRRFNLQTWYVISNEDYHFNTWFWIPATKALESGFHFISKVTGTNCLSVPVENFIQVSSDDSLERVFSKILKF